jgi:hypothetical protein
MERGGRDGERKCERRQGHASPRERVTLRAAFVQIAVALDKVRAAGRGEKDFVSWRACLIGMGRLVRTNNFTRND